MTHKAVEQDVDYHLEKALVHFEQALDLSVKAASENKAMQKRLLLKWDLLREISFNPFVKKEK
ncbi:hypothetical protein LQK80_24290 [Bacillus thuringiensis]|nr:hypothetical protein [Bacillus thuringiensis]